MRFIPVILFALALTACDMPDGARSGPVDPNTLAPISGRERALIFGADGAMQQGNYVQAEQDYLAAIVESKGHVDAHIALARLYDKQHFPLKEREVLKAAVALQPNHPLANYMLGKIYLSELQYSDAQAAFKRGRISRPEDIDLSIGEGITNDMMGDHRGAQRVYQRAMNLNPQADLTNLRTNLAMSYMMTNEPKRAVELLKADAKKPGASPVVRHNLALAYGMLGKNTEAKTVLKGEVDEETRQLAIARMKQYVEDRSNDIKTPPPQSTVGDAAPQEAVNAEPVVAPKPAKPVVLKKPSAPVKPAPQAPAPAL